MVRYAADAARLRRRRVAGDARASMMRLRYYAASTATDDACVSDAAQPL